jgi:small subunit ribosomal protein S2
MNKQLNILEELFQAKVHLGHKKNRVHPASRKYIYNFENNVSIIDLEATLNQINKVREVIERFSKEKKVILFVTTKKIINNLVQEVANKSGSHYLTTKWPSGFLTNFPVVQKNIEVMKKMIDDQSSGAWKGFPKHEQMKLEKKLKRLKQIYEGVINLDKLPDAVFIVDFRREKNALIEAKKQGIITMGICDTNVNPDEIDYPVMGNDDLYSSVECLLRKIFE